MPWQLSTPLSPLYVWTGLLIFAFGSLILGVMISINQRTDDARPAREREQRSLLRTGADALFFWISDDFRYVVAYPWLIFGLNLAVVYIAPSSWPARVYHCDGDIYGCLGVYDYRPHN
jgi:hypothetical protein